MRALKRRLRKRREKKAKLNSARQILADTRQAYTSVTEKWEQTEEAAQFIPEDSKYGKILLDRYNRFKQDYYRVAEFMQSIGSISEEELAALPDNPKMREAYGVIMNLDELDDTIINSSNLLFMGAQWESAWAKQVSALTVRISSLEDEANQTGKDEVVEKVRALRDACKQETEELAGKLRDKSATPDVALARLDEFDQQLRDLSMDIARAKIAQAAESKSQIDEAVTALQETIEAREAALRSSPYGCYDYGDNWTYGYARHRRYYGTSAATLFGSDSRLSMDELSYYGRNASDRVEAAVRASHASYSDTGSYSGSERSYASSSFSGSGGSSKY